MYSDTEISHSKSTNGTIERCKLGVMDGRCYGLSMDRQCKFYKPMIGCSLITTLRDCKSLMHPYSMLYSQLEDVV